MSLKRHALFMLVPLTLLGCATRQPAETATLEGRVASLEQEVRALSGQVQDAIAAQKKIRVFNQEAFTVLLTDDKGLYPINYSELSRQDADKLDGLADRLAGLNQEYRLEVQGHTDSFGTDDYNYGLGKARAEAVLRYLHDRKGIPLDQISVISLGAGNPTGQDGQGNRRIVIRALVAQ